MIVVRDKKYETYDRVTEIASIYFSREDSFPLRECNSCHPARTVTSYEPSSLREIQSCAGPRTKIFLCSTLSKKKIITEKQKEEEGEI